MGELVAKLKTTWQQASTKIHGIPDACKALNVEQVKDYLDFASIQTKRMSKSAKFAKIAGNLGDAGEKLGTAAKQLDDVISKAKGGVSDASAACDIAEAVAILRKWNNDTSVSNAEAAGAFDKLFGGAARYFDKLPFPAKLYAKIFEEIGKDNFFKNMENIMNLEGTTARGRMLHEIMDGIDAQGRP